MNIKDNYAINFSLVGCWSFRFEEEKTLEECFSTNFESTDMMIVPGCWDIMPKWYLKRGTGLYRRVFTLDHSFENAMLVIDGMGVRLRVAIDGRDLGTYAYPYAKLEIPVGKLDVGDHVIIAATDNIVEWPRVKLARPFYDFHFYGGFYHGIRLEAKQPKIFVRTLDYRAGTVEIETEGVGKKIVTVPDFKLWSPDSPNLTTLDVDGRKVRFGIRQVEAKNGKILLNGKEIFLKGFNRHESSALEGAATSRATMLRDLQNLKALGGNFIRGAHYQQSEEFLDLCDEMGVLVWEESLGWGNGQSYTISRFPPDDVSDAEFCDMQLRQTREMVRASFNHPSVIIHGFLNEPNGTRPETKALVDKLISTVKAENSGRLVTFACNITDGDICNENTDLISINSYPGTIPMEPGPVAKLKEQVDCDFTRKIARFRERYPDKPIIVSESGVGAMYGEHDPAATIKTEEFQTEYLTDIMETLWANQDVCGFAIWQMNDGRTRERYCHPSSSAEFGGSVAGVFDRFRRPKSSANAVKRFFDMK